MTIAVQERIAEAYDRNSLAAIYMDLQNKFTESELGKKNGAIKAAGLCSEFSDAMREKNIPNYWVIQSLNHEEGRTLSLQDAFLLPRREQFKIVRPTQNEPIINKSTQSAITATNRTLANLLMAEEKDTFLFLGVLAHVCVAATIQNSLSHLRGSVQALAVYDGMDTANTTQVDYLTYLQKRCNNRMQNNKQVHLTTSHDVYNALGFRP